MNSDRLLDAPQLAQRLLHYAIEMNWERVASMKKVGAVATVFLTLSLLGPAWGGTLMMEAEVLEGSGAMAMPGAAPDPIRYAIVHHHRAQDQARLSTWLRTRSGSLVTFFTKDGVSHQAVLKRLKHCFGRGLLVYSDLVDLAEKDIVRLGLLVEETKP